MADSSELVRAIDHYTEAVRRTAKDDALDPGIQRLAKRLRRHFKRQGAAFLKGLAGVAHHFPTGTAEARTALREAVTGSWEPIFDSVRGDADLADDLDGDLSDALTSGGQALINSLRPRQPSTTDSGTYDPADMGVFNVGNPRAVAWLDGKGAELVSGIDDTTRERLAALITRGVNQGLSYQRIADNIRGLFDNWAQPQEHIRDRAEMIAVTELHSAYEAGANLGVQDLVSAGLAIEKNWLTVGDDRVDDLCQSNEEDGWIPEDQDHSSGDPYPPGHPGCRCTEEYRRATGDSG